MTKEPRWISKAAVLAIHERLLDEHGGAAGLIDEGGLDSALASPRNHFQYGKPNLFQLAAAYAFALTRNHPFLDGDKRIALTTAGSFLERNGYALVASEADAVAATVALSAGKLDEAGFATWLQQSSAAVPGKRRRTSRPGSQPPKKPRRPKG